MSPTTRFAGWQSAPSRSLVVDAPSLQANLEQMQRRAGAAALWPHVKTHKSLHLAQLQRQMGARGFTAALVEEAEALLHAGLGPVLLARPLIDAQAITRLVPFARQGLLQFSVDCAAHVAALVDQGVEGAVWIKVDVGLHRLGIAPDPVAVRALYDQICAPLRVQGLMSHAGHSYGAASPQAIRDIAAAERATLMALAETLPEELQLSVGATPTLLAGQEMAGLHQIRPGNYALLDLTAVGLGIATRDQISMAVVAQVLAVHPDRLVVDIGSKVLSSDRGAHGTSAVAGFGEVWAEGAEAALIVQRLSEEHGVTEAPPAGHGIKVGDKVLVLPNHACPVMNLGGSYLLLPEGTRHRLMALSSGLI